jgi:NADPH:quinone reductase
MSKAIRFHKTGGADVLVYEDVEVGDPGEGQARVRNKAIGLNFIDTYHRSGLYPLPLPSGVGLEAAGVVEAIGPGIDYLKVGDRVAYAGGPPGAYSEVRVMPADRLVKVPDGITDEQAAAMMLKGLTAQYLLRSTFRVQAGQTVLFHAAAGGVGLIAGQWLKALGVHAIGTVGSDEKAAIAKAHGYEHTIVYTRENFVERVKEIMGGAKLPVVYDSVGKDTYMGSLDCLQPRGMLVVFGNGSGPVPAFDLNLLAAKGSLYVTRPTLASYVGKRAELVAAADELFQVVLSGQVKIEINQRYALKDAQRAHTDLEGRRTTGSTILMP